jgi:hypothetical protein
MSNVYNFSAIDTPDAEARTRQDIVNSAYTALTNGTSGLKNFPIFLAECFEREVWKHERIFAGGSRCNPVPFREFIHAPYPTGLDASYDVIRPLIAADIKLLNQWDEACGSNQGQRSDLLYNIQEVPPPAPTGTSEQAGLRRLRKAAESGDSRAQQQLEDVLSGKVSVHRACVVMGWRKPTVTLRDEPVVLFEAALKKSTPLETAKRAWLKMSQDEREEFREWTSSL